MVQQFQVEAKGNRQHPQNRGHRGQYHRARPFPAGFQNGVDLANPVAAQRIERVDQHDVVVHHHTGQRDDADTGHHHPKGLTHDQQPQEHPDG